MHLIKNTAILIALAMLWACTPTSTEQHEEAPAKPTNIIFLIGDGMGLSAVTTGFYYGDQPSNFKRFKHIGLIKTSSATHKVTDSAASGTAMSSGYKTYNGAIGVDMDTVAQTNIAEILAERGWNTALVATSTITHATPASFYGHAKLRKMEEKIATQLVDSEIDFFAGGGLDFFHAREDGQDLLPQLSEKGFIVDTTALAKPEDLEPGKKYGFLLAGAGMPRMLDGRGDFLPKATELAIDHLTKDEAGFFLMVEGSQIDWAGHGNDKDYLITEMLDFEQVIGKVMDFAEKDGNTLVVITADHETGGYTLAAEGGDYNLLGPVFSTTGHSASLIPVFAYGPGAEEFMGIYENTELFHKMAALSE